MTDARDVARQVANIAGAAFQVAAGTFGLLFGLDVGQISDQNRTLVVPAGYAFSIWGIIFLLCLGYAAYQATPSRRNDPTLRRVGWWSAGAFVCNGIWEVVFPNQWFIVAQVIIIGSLVFAVIAFLRFADAVQSRRVNRLEHWLVAPTLGLLAGWITAANGVSVATTLTAINIVETETTQAILGAVLLIAASLFAAVVISHAKAGPVTGTIAYAAAIIWALIAIVINQYAVSTVTTGAAIAAAIPVIIALIRPGPTRPTVDDRSGSQATIG